jgi:DNA-binding CsgD family transcriptional regulator
MRTPILTPRQRMVLKLIAQGYSSRRIAARLRITVNTVIYHRRNLYKRFRVRNVAALLMAAHQLKIR